MVINSQNFKRSYSINSTTISSKASQDAQQYEVALNLNEDSTVSLALANNRTAKQSLWDYQAAKATVSATAAGKILMYPMHGKVLVITVPIL